MDHNKIREMVRKNYSQVVKNSNSCCCTPGSGNTADILNASEKLGYSQEQLEIGLGEANFGLGCGNPLAIGELKKGEIVLDLGSGAGFDAFLAAPKVGSEGKVIGVDMTAEMIAKARENAEKLGMNNVEFRLGEIEHLPAADSCIDVIISNCVINLSPDKEAVFSEAFRVLRPGGRIAISDVIRVTDLPNEVKNNSEAYCGCISGAISSDELTAILTMAGFINISIKNKENSEDIIKGWNLGKDIEKAVVSAYICANKPALA